MDDFTTDSTAERGWGRSTWRSETSTRTGKLDVALAGYISSTQEIVQIELGKGDGTFTKGQTINMAPYLNATGITAGDFNGDGKLDLAVTSNTANQVYFYRGFGTGTFTSAASVTVGSTPGALGTIRVGDFNGDGKSDLVVSNLQELFVLRLVLDFLFDCDPVQDELLYQAAEHALAGGDKEILEH